MAVFGRLSSAETPRAVSGWPVWLSLGLAMLVGAALPIAPSQVTLVVAACVGLIVVVTGTAFLYRASDTVIWRVWLATLAIGSFGPFLDIVTRLPIMWLLGAFVIGLAILRALRSGVIFADLVNRRASTLYVCLLFYTAYNLLQTFRPSGHLIANILLFREAIIWIFTYWLVRRLLDAQPDQLRARLRQFAALLVVCGAVGSAYGIFQFLVGQERLLAWGLLDPTSWYITHERALGNIEIFRISGPLRRNETFGFYLDIAIVAVAVLLTSRVRRWYGLALAVPLILIGLVLSFSLAAMLHLGMFIVAYGLLTRQILRPLVLRLLALSVGAVILVEIMTGGILTVRLEGHLIETEDALAGGVLGGRVGSTLNWMREIGVRSPWANLVGDGLVSSDSGALRISGFLESLFGVSAEDELTNNERTTTYLIADNWYASQWVDKGALGFVLLLAPFAIVLLQHLPRIARFQDRPTRYAGLALVAYTGTMIPQGLLNTMFAVMPIPLLFWSIMAFLDALATEARRERLLARSAPLATPPAGSPVVAEARS